MSRTGPSAITPATPRSLAPRVSRPPQQPASRPLCCSIDDHIGRGPPLPQLLCPGAAPGLAAPVVGMPTCSLRVDHAASDARRARLISCGTPVTCAAKLAQLVQRIRHGAGIKTAQAFDKSRSSHEVQKTRVFPSKHRGTGFAGPLGLPPGCVEAPQALRGGPATQSPCRIAGAGQRAVAGHVVLDRPWVCKSSCAASRPSTGTQFLISDVPLPWNSDSSGVPVMRRFVRRLRMACRITLIERFRRSRNASCRPRRSSTTRASLSQDSMACTRLCPRA